MVAAGYVAAGLLASAAVAIRFANTAGADADASSGMYAFGDALLFVAVFGLASLLPTGAALMEVLVGAYGGYVWFVPLMLHRA